MQAPFCSIIRYDRYKTRTKAQKNVIKVRKYKKLVQFTP